VLGTLVVAQLTAEVKLSCEHAGNLDAAPPLWCFTVV
jgi:hypothetical protein